MNMIENIINCPIEPGIYITKSYIDPNMLSNYLIYEYPDEFYLYIPDIAAPGIKPFSYLISNYGKIFGIDSTNYKSIYRDNYDNDVASFYVYRNKKICQRNFQIKRLVYITFSLFFENYIDFDFLNYDIWYMNSNKKDRNEYHNLYLSKDKYRYRKFIK